MAADLMFNTFESPSSGTTIAGATGSNADGSSAWTSVSIASGGTLATDSTHFMHGAQGLKAATAATAAITYCAWGNTVGPLSNSSLTMFGRSYHMLTALPAATFQMVRFLGAANGTAGGVQVQTTGKLQLQDANGTLITGTQTTNTITANTWFRVEYKFVAATTTTGLAEIKLFLNADSITATETLTSAATQNIGTTAIQGLRVGVLSATANIGPYWTDDVAVNDLGYPGPSIQAYSLPAIRGPYHVVAPVRSASF